MCKTGFNILEMFPVTASYMPGPFDVLHYLSHVFSTAEDELEMYMKNGSEYSIPKVCIF